MPMATESPASLFKKASVFAVAGGPAPRQEEAEWEVRPGGMLVQRRSADADAAAPPAPTIRVRVKHGATLHDVHLSSQATFGDLKKLLAERTGLHPQDQKLLFKGKEKGSNAFLDTSGVRDRAKVVLVEDPGAHARRVLELRRAAKAEKASRDISRIGHEVDKLAAKVTQLETVVGKGKKVAEGDVVSLIEQLMNQLLNLDAVVVPDDGVKLQRRMQVRRVQKYVEALDVLKVKNATVGGESRTPPTPAPPQRNRPSQHRHEHRRQQEGLHAAQQPPVVVAATQWETFDLLSGPPSVPPPPALAAAAAHRATAAPVARLEWELF